MKKFVELYKSAFGDAAPLPIAFGYSYEAAAEIRKIPRCMVGAIRKVCDGMPLTLCSQNVTCGGGSLYTAFAPMQERTPKFVAEAEHYKQYPEQVKRYVADLGICLTEKPYLNFSRIDKLSSLEGIEGVLFFATPDILSGLCSWAFYDNDSPNAVLTKFASGCCSAITFAVQENERNGRSCFIGMLDPSARLLVPENELTLSIPACRFAEMKQTIEDSALFQKAFTAIKRRINK